MIEGVLLVVVIGTLALAISLGYSYGFEKGMDEGIRDVISIMPYDYASALADAVEGQDERMEGNDCIV